MASRWSKRESTAEADLAPPAEDPRNAVGGVPHERQPIRDGTRPHAELLEHAVLVEEDVAATVPAHDAHAADRLR